MSNGLQQWLGVLWQLAVVVLHHCHHCCTCHGALHEQLLMRLGVGGVVLFIIVISLPPCCHSSAIICCHHLPSVVSPTPVPLGHHHCSTHHPPYEQLLVRLEAGGVLFLHCHHCHCHSLPLDYSPGHCHCPSLFPSCYSFIIVLLAKLDPKLTRTGIGYIVDAWQSPTVPKKEVVMTFHQTSVH